MAEPKYYLQERENWEQKMSFFLKLRFTLKEYDTLWKDKSDEQIIKDLEPLSGQVTQILSTIKSSLLNKEEDIAEPTFAHKKEQVEFTYEIPFIASYLAKKMVEIGTAIPTICEDKIEAYRRTLSIAKIELELCLDETHIYTYVYHSN